MNFLLGIIAVLLLFILRTLNDIKHCLEDRLPEKRDAESAER